MNKVYLITGAGHFPGIGSCTAEYLLKENNYVVINSRTFDENWIDIKQKYSDRLQIVVGDITQPDIQNEFINTAIDNWKRIDVLINNASFVKPNDASDRDIWYSEFLINTIVPYELSMQCKPYLERTNGSIVMIGSRVGLQVAPEHNMVYGTAKAAMHQLTKSLAVSLSPHIRVNALLPGMFESARFNKKFNDKSTEIVQKYVNKSLLHSTLEAQEIVNSIVFLANNKNITGQLLPICNGASVNIA
jgi:3-oxoacyl-[acyl-carrier protein] reductase